MTVLPDSQVKAVCLAVALSASLALAEPALAQSPLAAPTGAFQVGTILLTLVDSSRAELSHPDTVEPRHLNVQVWYPADPAPDTRLAPMVPEFSAIAPDIRESYPTLSLEALKTAAFWDAPPRPGRRFPLIVFSHGMNTARFLYTGLLQDLASHGFVVAAIDHPFWTIGASFPDGNRLTLAESMASRDRLTSDQIDALMQDGVGVMAADQGFVASRLSSGAPRLRSIIDDRRVGVMGHSMGGMAATQACWTYRVFSSCVSLDGLVWAREGLSPIGEPPNRVAKPFLMLLAPQFLPSDLSSVARRYRRAWRDPSLCLVPGLRHNSFSDLPQLRGTAPGKGELDPAIAASLIHRLVIAFFQSAFADPPSAYSPPVDTLVRALPGDSMPRCSLTGL
jgi:dienelactone hydrolase